LRLSADIVSLSRHVRKVSEAVMRGWLPRIAQRHSTDLHCNHSITSSARASSDGGTVRPSALAVMRLITSSNLVGCSTGRSEGLAPLRILSMYPPARKNNSAISGPYEINPLLVANCRAEINRRQTLLCRERRDLRGVAMGQRIATHNYCFGVLRCGRGKGGCPVPVPWSPLLSAEPRTRLAPRIAPAGTVAEQTTSHREVS